MKTKGKLKSAKVTVTIIRKDGTQQHLGVVASYHHNKLIHHIQQLILKLKRKLRS